MLFKTFLLILFIIRLIIIDIIYIRTRKINQTEEILLCVSIGLIIGSFLR